MIVSYLEANRDLTSPPATKCGRGRTCHGLARRPKPVKPSYQAPLCETAIDNRKIETYIETETASQYDY